jgi:hypothetical protein
VVGAPKDIRHSHVPLNQEVNSYEARKRALFKATRDRSLDRSYSPLPGVPSSTRPLCDETSVDPLIVRVAYRSFDRQYLIHDRRVIDFPRSDLWLAHGDRQVYVSEQHAHPISDGTALTFSALVPNVHHFNGRGGRVLPLYRNHLGRVPNLAPGLLLTLQEIGGAAIAEDVLAYLAAVVAHPGYTHRFVQELRTPGIRVPITTRTDLWHEAIQVGQEVIWLHTYGSRYCDEDAGRPRSRPRTTHEGRRPRLIRSIPASPERMPDYVTYSRETQTLMIGRRGFPDDQGVIEHVSPAVWAYTVGGGVPVVRRWLNYRPAAQAADLAPRRDQPPTMDSPVRRRTSRPA